MSKVFVSILNYKRASETLSCLDSLEKSEVKDFNLNVVVIDNGSKEVFRVNENNYKKFTLKVIRSDENLGFSGGQNMGIKYSLKNGADYVVVLNNDVILEKNLLTNLLKTFEEKKDCGLVSPKIYFAKGHEFHKKRYKKENLGKVIWYAGGLIDWGNVIATHKGVDEVDNGRFETLEKTDFASGCCIMIKKEVFEKVGLFDQRYFLYYEDNDLSQRAKRNGFEIYYQPKGVLWHINAGSAGGSGSFLQDYYITRNRMLFGLRFAPFRAKLALLKESVKILLTGRKWQKMGILDFYKGNFGKGSYG